jgi:microcystin synthetase protein McyD
LKNYKDLLKSSILKIQEKDRRIRELETERDEPVAIIGMSCRFPGAVDPEAFWQLIEDGADVVATMTDQRWNMDDYFSATAGEPGKINTRRFGLLDDVDQFDPTAFGMSEDETPYIDPQHRMLLEQAWFCFERAGIDVGSVKGGDIGVFVGQMNSDYTRLIKSASDLNPYVGVGNALSAAAGRLSYVFGLKGPSMSVDTACSSSLVAVHLACQSLRMGECAMALAGGVNLLLSPEAAIGASVSHMLSARGRCNTFGSDADGYVRAEGCGLVLLKTLARAQADGDTILVVIRGSAVNQDGRSHGLSAPNGPAQIEVMRRALARAQVDPAEVGYLESHGTGTPLGDPVEVQAIDTVYGRAEGRVAPLALGAVKANIGHCESAAGVAGLIKLVLLLQHDRLPPIAHLDRLNPHFEDLSDQLLFPKISAQPWSAQRPSLAALSSFGYTGTNAHLLLERASAAPALAPADGRQQAFCFSAHSASALRHQLQQLAQRLRVQAPQSLSSLAAAIGRIRGEMPYRYAFVAATEQELLSGLEQGAGRDWEPPAKTALALRFGATGAATFGAELRARFEEVAAITLENLDGQGDSPLLARFAVQYLRARKLATLGLQARQLRAVGPGVPAALACAGVLTVEQALQLVQALAAPLSAVRAQALVQALELAEAEQPLQLAIDGAWQDWPYGRPEQARRLLSQTLALAPEQFDALPVSPPPSLLELDLLSLQILPAAPSEGHADAADQAWTGLLVELFNRGLSPRLPGPGDLDRPLLPDYPFDRRRYWLPEHVTARVASLPLLFGAVRHGIFSTILAEPDGGSLLAGELSLARLPFLRDHVVAGEVVLPASVYLDLIAEACAGPHGAPARVERLRIMQACVLGEQPLGVYCRVGVADDALATINIFTKQLGSDEWRHHASASVNLSAAPAPRQHVLDADQAACPHPLAAQRLREQAHQAGIDYGPSFQAIGSLARGPGCALAKLAWPGALSSEWSGRSLHPVLLDACFQVISAAVGESRPAEQPPKLFVPMEIHGLEDSGRRSANLWCFVRILGPASSWDSDQQLHDYLRPREHFSAELRVYDEHGDEVLAIERFDAALYRPQAPAEVWRDWLLEKHWPALPPGGSGLALGAEALLALARPQFGAAAYVVEQSVLQGFDELAAGYIQQAFEDLGVAAEAEPSADQLVQSHGVLPAYRRLAERLLVLRRSLALPQRPAAQVEAALRHALGTETRELDLLLRCGCALAEVLRGRVNALDLLFEPARSEHIEAVYQDSAATKALNDRVAALVAQALDSLPAGRRLRILEVGAGTGATTSRVLLSLRGREADYVFTDLSGHFLHRAEEKFQGETALQYRLFDLEAEPRGQGFEPGQFDLVIAVNVVHATTDLARTLQHLSYCLAEGGMLLLRELTRPQAWLDLSFGLTPGWWNFTDLALRQVGPLLDTAKWEHLLREGGFEPALVTAEDGRTESLFVAQKQTRRTAGHWVVFAEADGWSEQLRQALVERGQAVSWVEPAAGQSWQGRDDVAALLAELELAQGPVSGVIYAWSLRPAALDQADLALLAEPYLKYPLWLCQVLLQPRWRHLRASFLTAGAQPVAGEVAQPLQAMLWGHVFAFVNENASFVRLIDVDLAEPVDERLLDALEQEQECQLALRSGHTLAARLRPATLQMMPSSAVAAQASYLITGGFGDLGLQTAQILAAQGARQVVLLGRRARTEAELALQALRLQGVQVYELYVDVGDEAALRAALDGLLPGLLPLRGVVHSVGVLDDGVIEQQSWERYLRVLRPKVFGAIHLQRAVAACDLDFFVIYSSATAIMGNPGQANHAAANAFLDAFAWHLRGQGRPGLAIGWGAWSQIGAAAARDIGARLSANDSLAAVIPPEQGLAVIERQFGCSNTQFTVLPLNRRLQLDANRQPQVQRLLTELLEQPRQAAAAKVATVPGEDLLLRLQRMGVPERRRHIEAYLQQQVIKLLKRPGQIEPQTSLFDLGLDSLLVIDLRGILQRDFRQEFESTLLFDYPSIASLTDFLLKSLPARQVEQAAPAVASKPAPTVASMFAQDPAGTDDLIGVIGMACRFPGGANTPQQFWELLKNGVDTVSPIPIERWDHAKYYDRERGRPGKAYVAEGCFVDQVDQFYPERFGIAGIEAELMDPQQRMLLDVSYEALESAGQDPTALGGTETGVFMGVMTQDYLRLTQNVREHAFYVGTGSANSVVAGRLSHAFGLMGPSMTVDTACSSSLVTVQLACAHLRSGGCDMALAGGVSLQLSPETLVLECAGGMLSSSGRCRTFDAAADGFVRGEGCGVVVLKRLADAVAQGDAILGVIRGGAVNHDGRAGGLTVPNGLSQQRVLEKALRAAAVEPEQVSYIEAHGTGTHLGDPIELNALQAVFGKARRVEALTVGSVKTNIGHAEAAAGIAGLIKVLLCFQHRMLPPHLHLQQPNPNFDWARSELVVPVTLQPWQSPQPLLAGVSSFGLSGTNAHLVLEEYRAPAASRPLPFGFEPLAVLSQVSREQLAADAARYAQALAEGAPDVAEVAYTLSVSRAGRSLQAVLPASSMVQLLEGLNRLAAGAGQVFARPAARLPLAWRLAASGEPGWASAAPTYYDQYMVFRATVDACAEALRAGGHAVERARELCTGEALHALAQVRAGVLGLAYGRLLLALGVQPERLQARGAMLFCAAALGGAADVDAMLAGLLADSPAAWQSALAGLRLASSEAAVRFEPEPQWPDSLNRACAQACESAFPQDHQEPAMACLELFSGSLGARPGSGLAALLGALAEQGQPLDWQRYFEPVQPRKLVLPTSHFPTRRYWVVDEAPATPASGLVVSDMTSLVVSDLTSARDGRRYVDFELDMARHPFLHEHRIGSTLVLPAAGTLAFVLHALGREALASGVALEELTFLRPLRFEQRLSVQLELGADGLGHLHHRLSGGNGWQPFAALAGLAAAVPAQEDAPALLESLRAIRERAAFCLDGSTFYTAYLPQDLHLGASFRRIERIWREGQCAVAKIRTVFSDFAVDPRALDACLQMVNVLGETLGEDPGGMFLPFAIRRAALAGWPTGEHFWCLSRYLPQLSGPNEQVYDIAIVDEHDRLCARFEQVSFRKVAAPAHIPQASSQLLHQPAWQAVALPATAAPATALPLLLIGRQRPLLSRLQASLGDGARQVWCAPSAGDPAEARTALRACLEQAADVQVLVYADLLDESDDDSLSPADWTAQAGSTGWNLAQWLAAASDSTLPLVVLTRSSQCVNEGFNDQPNDGPDNRETPASVLGHAAAALVRTAALEFPSLRVRLLDLDLPDLGRPEELAWLAELTTPTPTLVPVVAYRRGLRYQPILRLVPWPAPGATPVVRAGCTYVISGGLGEIGLLVAELLVEQGATALALLARSARPQTNERVAALRRRGCQVQVLIGDIADLDSLRAQMEQVHREMPPLAGVLHAAGMLADALLKQQGPEHWQPVLAAKMQGALNLFQLCAPAKLDFFVLFSSIVSIGGSVGQANYALANGLLDGLARRWSQQGLPVLSINWGAWLDTGMARRAEARGVEFLQRLSTGQALAGLLAMLQQPHGQMACYTAVEAIAQDAIAVDAQPGASGQPPSALHAGFSGLLATEQATLVADAIRERLVVFLKIEARQVSDERAFFDLGMDSLTAVEFSRHLGKSFALDLHVDTIFDYPSVSSLTGHVLRLLRVGEPALAMAEQGESLRQEEALSIDEISRMLKLELGDD